MAESGLVPADDFEAVFVTEAGVGRRVPWWRLPDVVDDLDCPAFLGLRFSRILCREL
jgi:hypothetical protein